MQSLRGILWGPDYGGRDFSGSQKHTASGRIKREKLRPEVPNTLTYFLSCQGFQRIILKKKNSAVSVISVNKIVFTLLISCYNLK